MTMEEKVSRPDGSFFIPDFVEIQKKSFFQFVEAGIIKEFQRMGPIRAGAGEVKILFHPTRFVLTPPDCSIRKAILQGKTYESKLYVPATMVSKGGVKGEAEWVLIGSIPLMTRRGHFIINGSPRVIVNQMVRSPGIYFHKRFVGGKKRRRVYYADLIPLFGSWIRLQQREGEDLYVHLKRTPKIPSQLLSACMAALEQEGWKGRERGTSSMRWRYRSRLAFHLLDHFVRGSMPDDRWKKIEEKLDQCRGEEEGGNPPLARELRLAGWVGGRWRATDIDQDLLERIIPPVSNVEGSEGGEEGRLDADSSNDESVKPLPTTKGEGWREAFLAGARAWSRHRIEEVAIDSTVEGQDREMTINEIAFFLSLPRRRSMASSSSPSLKGMGMGMEIVGKTDQLLARLEMADLDQLPSHFTTSAGWGAALTKMTSLLFLRASPSRSRCQRARSFVFKKLKNPAAYTLGRLGRTRLDKKLGDGKTGSLLSCGSTQLMARDLELAQRYMERFKKGKVVVDDIDHLKNRRVKTCGELLQNQFQVGLDRLQTLVRFKVSRGEESLSVKRVIDVKALDTAWREFFGSNPLSQYMDQTNPLAEITHKRRVSCLGPGGVSRETAGMSMRGIHPSHYGRICPIETPEGKNAGLVNSLTSYTRVGPEGVLETPYYRVEEGFIQRRKGFHFFSSQREEEERAKIAPADILSSRSPLLPTTRLPLRRGDNLIDNFNQAARERIQYVGISRIQMISIATSLIPFLEHNDANRALMGSNMQRQAVPPLTLEHPIVGTGLEGRVVGESGHVLEAQTTGRISYVSGRMILVQRRERGRRETAWSPRIKPRVSAPSLGGAASFDLTGKRIRLFSPASTSATKSSLMKRKGGVWEVASALTHVSVRRRLGVQSPPSSRLDPSSVGDAEALQKRLLQYATLRSPHLPFPDMGRGVGEGGFDSSPLNGDEWGLEMGYDSYSLQPFEQSNQKTSLCQRPWVREGEWVQPGDLLADCAASQGGRLCLGRNVIVAYLPWDGYNFEDAVVVSDRLLFDDLYTSLHIERYDLHIEETEREKVKITRKNEFLSRAERACLDKDGVIRVGRWVETGDLLVSRVVDIEKRRLSGYQRLAYEILRKKPPTTRDISLRVGKWIEGRIIEVEKEFEGPPRGPKKLVSVRLYLVERKKIQVGDKVAGRHGNKGIVSTILPRQDMPYLPDGTTVDMVLNPLGVPSRMNVGQVFESLLGLAGGFLRQRFTITPFDEMYGAEASRSLVYLKLYQARLRTGHDWLFCPDFPGKSRIFDGRSGEAFHQPVTVGRAYMLKLIHLVDEKIHARARGPYSLITQQPVRGRSKGGGQRLGEMEVWAVEGYGAAYTLQEILTTKSDDLQNRRSAWQWIVQDRAWKDRKELPVGRSGGFLILLRELQSLCFDVGLVGSRPPQDGQIAPSPLTKQKRGRIRPQKMQKI